MTSSCFSNSPLSEIASGLPGGLGTRPGFNLGNLAGKLGGLFGAASAGPAGHPVGASSASGGSGGIHKPVTQPPPAGGLPFGGGPAGLFPGGLRGTNILLVKGHEANHVNFASYNGTGPKSGLWVGKNDKILNSVEVVNYKDVPQDVYFTIDAEYLDFTSKPADYLEVGFSMLNAMDCKDLGMSELWLLMVPNTKIKTPDTNT